MYKVFILNDAADLVQYARGRAEEAVGLGNSLLGVESSKLAHHSCNKYRQLYHRAL